MDYFALPPPDAQALTQEQQTLATEWLRSPEICLLWEPIPPRFAHRHWVDVTHVAEDYGSDHEPSGNLTIALASFCAPTAALPHDAGAWRIDFTDCQAYRARYIHVVGAAPLTRPDVPADAPSALWEITGSHYLVESGVWAAHKDYIHRAFHHYVIVSAPFFAHEVVARGWRCTPLPADWAQVDHHGLLPPWPPKEV